VQLTAGSYATRKHQQHQTDTTQFPHINSCVYSYRSTEIILWRLVCNAWCHNHL